MKVDWSELVACRGNASAFEVPKAIDMVFSASVQERQQAYWMIDNHVVVQGGLFESAPYAARLLVDAIKASPDKLHSEILDNLFELANGNAGGKSVEHGALKGQPVQQFCRDTVAEELAVLRVRLSGAGEQDRMRMQDILELYEEVDC